MQVGNYKSLTEMVQATPVFHQAELETFQQAAMAVIEQAEGVMTSADDYRRVCGSQVTPNMRDLQGAFRAGFP